MVKANAKVPLDGSITTNGLFLEQTYPASGMFSISKEEHPNQYDAEPDESHGDDFIIASSTRKNSVTPGFHMIIDNRGLTDRKQFFGRLRS